MNATDLNRLVFILVSTLIVAVPSSSAPLAPASPVKKKPVTAQPQERPITPAQPQAVPTSPAPARHPAPTMEKKPAAPLHEKPTPGVQPPRTPRHDTQHRLSHAPDFLIENVRYYPPGRKISFELVNRGAPYQGELTAHAALTTSTNLNRWVRLNGTLRRHGRQEMAVPFTFPDYPNLCSLPIEIMADPLRRVRELNEGNNLYRGPVYPEVRPSFLIIPNEVGLLLQRHRFNAPCSTGPGLFTVRKEHLGTDYDAMGQRARLKLGIPLKNCSCSNGNDDSLTLAVYRQTGGNSGQPLIELPHVTEGIFLQPEGGRFFEKSFYLPVAPGVYEAVLRKEANVQCLIRWRFAEEFFH